jgi:hypothetical protein
LLPALVLFVAGAAFAVIAARQSAPAAGPASASREATTLAAPSTPVPSAAGRMGYEILRLDPDRLRLTGAAASLDDLLRTVERALAERDSTRLQELLVTEREFREILFPAFPAAHPPINADFASVWVNHFPDSQRGLRQLLEDYGGRRIRIQSIRFDRPGQAFVNFVLDETSHVDLEVDGQRRSDVQLFGSVFHVGDQYKMLSYPDD